MSVLQDRLLLVFGDVGRVAVTEKSLMARLQERWPTQHGYALQVIEDALKSMAEAGLIHKSASGRWTKFLNMSRETPQPAAPAPDDPIAEQPESTAAADATQENEVSEKTKVCTGKCGKEKPIGEFYAHQGKCKSCFAAHQRELKAAKAKAAKPKTAATASPTIKAKAIKNVGGATEYSMVSISFALNIEDINGTIHKFPVTKATVSKLVNELKAYA